MPGGYDDDDRELAAPNTVFPRHTKNAKGAHVSFRMPDGLEREVDRVIQLGRERGLPWQSRSDLCRDAVAWFLSALLKKIEFNYPFVVALQARKEVADRLEYMHGLSESARKSVQSLVSLANELISANETATARREFQEFERMVRSMTDRYIRAQYDAAMATNDGYKATRNALFAIEQEAAHGSETEAPNG